MELSVTCCSFGARSRKVCSFGARSRKGGHFVVLLSTTGGDADVEVPCTVTHPPENSKEEPLRILIVNKYARVTGGADVHCFGLARALRERGHEVAFLSTASAENVERQGEFVSCRVTSGSRDALDIAARVGVAARALWSAEAAAAMERVLDRFRPDIVHAHKLYPQLSVSPVVVAARRRIPVIQTLHDYELISASALDSTGAWRDRDESRWSYRLLNSATYPLRRFGHARCIRRWIAVSRFVAARYSAHGIDAEVLLNFVDAASTPVAGFAERCGLAFAGRLVPAKGVRDVLEVAASEHSLPVVVAGDGPLRAEVERAAELLPNLTCVGQLDAASTRTLVASSRLLLMPSRWDEPGPLTALEAMALGTPVIAYASGGLAEYVADARAGVVVAPSAATLAEECSRLHDDAARWDELSRNGQVAAMERHAVAPYIARLERIYEDAAA